jgi:lycopene cyclase domain-containing protein
MTVFAIIPSLVLLYFLRKSINFKNLLISIIALFIIGVIWDQISVRLGIWSFSQDKTIGNIFGMPIEEYIFMIFVSLLVITVYTLINKIMKKIDLLHNYKTGTTVLF